MQDFEGQNKATLCLLYCWNYFTSWECVSAPGWLCSALPDGPWAHTKLLLQFWAEQEEPSLHKGPDSLWIGSVKTQGQLADFRHCYCDHFSWSNVPSHYEISWKHLFKWNLQTALQKSQEEEGLAFGSVHMSWKKDFIHPGLFHHPC